MRNVAHLDSYWDLTEFFKTIFWRLLYGSSFSKYSYFLILISKFAYVEISSRLTSIKNSKFRGNFFEVSTFQSNVCIIHYIWKQLIVWKVNTSKKFSRNFELFIEVDLGKISTYANFEIKIQEYEYFEKLEIDCIWAELSILSVRSTSSDSNFRFNNDICFSLTIKITKDEQSDYRILSKNCRISSDLAGIHRKMLVSSGQNSDGKLSDVGIFWNPIETQIFWRFPTSDNFPSESCPKDFIGILWIR